MTIEKASQWVRQLGIIPVFLPHSAIVDADGDRLEYLLGQDPLLCMQLFRVFAREENRPVTAAELIKNLNHTAIIAYSQQLPRQSTGNDGNHQLMSALADSWLANSFLRSWHNVRKVSWTEEDHWTCLFSDVPEWLVAYNDPMLLEGIVYRIQNGELRDQVFTEIFGFDYSELYQAAVINFGLPSVDRLGGNQGHQPFKYQALKYYLPISNQLATLCRQSPDNLDQGNLIAKAETATLIDDFRQQLPVWLASSARHSIWSFCHQAILGYFNTQPDLYKYDQMRARQSVPPTLSVESVQQSVEPAAELSALLCR